MERIKVIQLLQEVDPSGIKLFDFEKLWNILSKYVLNLIQKFRNLSGPLLVAEVKFILGSIFFPVTYVLHPRVETKYFHLEVK